eukprot:g7987.t1
MGVCRTVEELNEDVALILQHTRRIRLYSMECPDVMDALLTKASNGELSLLLGVWIENSPRDVKEMDLLMSYLKKYPTASIEGVVIGNEVIFKHQGNGAFMAAKVMEAKHKIGGLAFHTRNPTLGTIKVFSVEETPDTSVVGVSDAVGVNIHPYYDVTLEKAGDPTAFAKIAVERFALKLDYYKAKFPGRELIVTEVGWPTSSDPYAGDYQHGSESLQLQFILAFLKYTTAHPVNYYWFEFKNADWKKFGYNSHSYSEYHFGIYNSFGAQKSVYNG